MMTVSVAEVRNVPVTRAPDEPLHLFQATVEQTGPGEWSESRPLRCFRDHDLARPRAMLVGWVPVCLVK